MANANNNNIPFQQFNQNPMAQFLPQPQGNVYLINSSNEITLPSESNSTTPKAFGFCT